MKRIFGLAAALCLLGANGALAGGSVRVMTRNLYVGTDTDLVLAASRSELPLAVAEAYFIFQNTDYEARMAAIADEIASPDHPPPDLIGLQEATELYIQSPGDSLNPPTEPQSPAMDPQADFVGTLLAKLEDLGLHYRRVIRVKNVDLELPMATGVGYDDLRLMDYDVILARGPENCEPTPNSHECVPTSNVEAGTYRAAVHFQTATIRRGWVAVDATIDGTTVRFFSTHLEDLDTVRYAQTVELIRTLAVERRPLILVGDFNSKTFDDLAHRALVAAGYTDHWAGTDTNPNDPGNTCCQAADLNSVSPFTEHDDIIFTRNIARAEDDESTLIGNEPFQTSQPRWASDHAGVWAVLAP